MVAPFGTALHVSGRDAGRLDAATQDLRRHGPQVWTPGHASLEDVFIDLMSRTKDNFA
jgi:ABC-2 type transport system ATP-binding protein